MKRDEVFHRDKALLAMQRERKALWKRLAQTIAIDPPIPRGWVRHWRLTTKAACRHDAPILRIILTKIDNLRFHWRRSFQYGKHRQRRMIENTQGLCAIRESKWARSGWPDAWKKYFRQILVNPGKSDQTFTYRFIREDLFELFVERHYVHHVRLLDSEAESREAEIAKHLEDSGGNHRLDKILDLGWRNGPNTRQRILDQLAAQRIRKAINGDWEAEMRKHTCFFIPTSQVIHFQQCSCSPTAEARRRERRQCGCDWLPCSLRS